MNKKIKLLIMKAGGIICSTVETDTIDKFDYHHHFDADRTIDKIDYHHFDAEKFAELIVEECMTICKEHPSRILSNNWNADAVAPDIVHRFEDHFGVEE